MLVSVRGRLDMKNVVIVGGCSICRSDDSTIFGVSSLAHFLLQRT